jgi:hypothetical protein
MKLFIILFALAYLIQAGGISDLKQKATQIFNQPFEELNTELQNSINSIH